MTSPHYITAPNGDKIATLSHQGASTRPGVMFLGGFMSDMTGSKALHLEHYCQKKGLNFVRFDYHGHGASGGDFSEGTISRWTMSALAVLDQLTMGPQILIGSSMGGWIGLRAILERPGRVAGMIGIAAAPDFIDRLAGQIGPDGFKQMMTQGYVDLPSDYGDEPYRFTKDLVLDGRRARVLNRLYGITCPIRLLQGMADPDVPWQSAVDLAEKLVHTDVDCTLIPRGDHRLSTPQDLDRLTRTLEALVDQVEQA